MESILTLIRQVLSAVSESEQCRVGGREEKKERWFNGCVNYFSIAVIRQCDLKGLIEEFIWARRSRGKHGRGDEGKKLRDDVQQNTERASRKWGEAQTLKACLWHAAFHKAASL